MNADGFVTCWGIDLWGEVTPPEGEFASVSAGGGHTCGVKTEGSVACWGNDFVGPSHAARGGVRLHQRRVETYLRVEDQQILRLLGSE